MPRLSVSERPRRKKKKRPLPLRERLHRFWRELRAGWPLWIFLTIYLAILFAIAINPQVSPYMPSRGKLRLLAALPLSYRLFDGSLWDRTLLTLAWLPWIPVIASIPRFPRWLREQREWERKAVIRRAREKERRARKRAAREAAKAD